MVNATIWVLGAPTLDDSDPDRFKIGMSMRDIEFTVERETDTSDDGSKEAMVTLTFRSKINGQLQCAFSLKDLRTRLDPNVPDEDGNAIYKDLNDLDTAIATLQELIIDEKLYIVHIWVTMDFLNDNDCACPMELIVRDPEKHTIVKDCGPFEYSYMKYKNRTDDAYRELTKEKDADG